MFDAGLWELVVIFVLALLVVGPERLPVLARKAGLWIGRAKRFVNSVRSDIERELRTEELEKMLHEQKDEIESLKSALNVTRENTEQAFRDASFLPSHPQDKSTEQVPVPKPPEEQTKS